MARIRTWLAGACVASGVLISPFPEGAVAQEAGDDVVIVDGEGEGLSKEEALKAALRDALEKGGKIEIFSDTKVENFQVMHDTILSRAEGIIKDYKVLEEKKVVGGTWKVKIKAKVSKSALATSWGEVQNVVNQIGRPKILVWINERIDKELVEGSQLEVLIEKPLIASGFDMVARQAIDVAKQKELADAAADDDISRLQSIAKDFDAHIFIAGTANADAAGVEEKYNVPIAFYNCDAQVKVYYTDSAKLLASEGIPNEQINGRGGARGERTHSPQAGRKALANIAPPMVDSLYQQIMQQWATQISAGGELLLEVKGLSPKLSIKLKKALTELKDVEHVNMDKSKELVRFRINAKFGAEQLVERLVEDPFEGVMEVDDWRLNRVQATAKPE